MAPHLQEGPLRFHPLAFLEDGGEVVVGRSDIDSYGVFPVDGAALVRELAAGRPPGDAADWYADTYGERIDMADFVATLHELHLVQSESEPEPATPAPVRGQRLGRALFSAPAWALYFALFAAAVLVCVLDGALLPRTGNVFFTGSLLLVAVAVFAGQLALTLWHEAFHVLAGRRLGIRSRIRISRRLYFVVIETNLDGLAVVERRRRYLPILAGLLADALAVAGLTVLAYLTRGWPVVSGLCLALAFTTLPRMAWQFYLFLRTDLYHLIATATGCVDLDGAARALIGGLIGRQRDEQAFGARDRMHARWYAPLLVIGYAWMLAVLALVLVPLLLRFWESTLLLALTLSQLAVALALALRERRADRRKTT